MALIALPCCGQTTDSIYISDTPTDTLKQNKKFIFGGTISWNNSYPQPTAHTQDKIPFPYRDSITGISGHQRLGLGVSVNCTYTLNKRLGIMAEAMVHSRSLNLYFTRPNKPNDTVLIGQTYIGLPLYFVLNNNLSKRINTKTGIGFNTRYAWRSHKIERMFDYSIDAFFAIGRISKKGFCDQLRISYSYGLTNFMKTRDNIYNWAIEKLAIHTLSVHIGGY